jgi:hypothetical protein
MFDAASAEPRSSDGVAIFAAAAFLLGLGVIATLERVGAPEALVQALGPLFALTALAIIGVLTRAPSLIDFLAARRSAPPFYGGLAFAATAAGMSGALASGSSTFSWRAFAGGLALAALIVAPSVRAAKASALADVFATAFPWRPTRVAFAAVLFATGCATAIAGFALAVDALVVGMGASRGVAEALVAVALALSLAPGGLKGLVWSDAACGGGALLIAGLGATRAALDAPAPLAPLEAALDAALGGGGSGVFDEIALALAVAGFFALTPPAIGARAVGQSRRVGLAGLACAALGVALAGVALPYFVARAGGPSRTAVGLIGAATWMPSLALARGGALGATRAWGFDVATAHSRLSVLASRKIAMNRLGIFAMIGIGAAASHLRWLDPSRALYLALAIGLAFVAPSLALAQSPRAGSGAAAAALAISLVVAVSRLGDADPLSRGPLLLDGAAIAGFAGLVGAALFALLFPKARRASAPRIADPFVDVPLEGLD